MKKILIMLIFFSLFATVSVAQTEKELFEEGVHHFKAHRFSKAAESFSSLIRLNPGNADAYKNRGVTYMRLNDLDAAIRDFLKAGQLFPELKGLYSNLGVAWYYKKEYEKAIESYNMEIALEPDQYVAYFNRALCHAELGKNDEALADLEKTLSLEPDFYDAICYKADILARTGQKEKAIEIYQEAVALDPEKPYAPEKLARLNAAQKKQASQSLVSSLDSEKGAAKNSTPSKQAANIATSKAGPAVKKKGHEIQVGAFLSRSNAEKMQKRLTSKGFDARVLILEDAKSRTWHLVRTGSYPDKAAAKEQIAVLKTAFGVSPMVRPYGDW